MSSTREYPNALTCPLTLARFIEPVIGSDCHTYERSAIITWLSERGTSPLTAKPMSMNSLRLNIAVKKVIEEMTEWYPEEARTDDGYIQARDPSPVEPAQIDKPSSGSSSPPPPPIPPRSKKSARSSDERSAASTNADPYILSTTL